MRRRRVNAMTRIRGEMMDASTPKLEAMTRGLWRAIVEGSVSAQFEPPARRNVRRYNIHGECMVHFSDDDGKRSFPLMLLNISLEGIMGRAAEEIMVDTPLDVHMPIEDHVFLIRGRIIHITSTLGGFKLGVRFRFDD